VCRARGGLNAGIDRLRQRLVDLAVLAQLGLGLLGRRDPFGVGEETVEVVEAAVLAIDDYEVLDLVHSRGERGDTGKGKQGEGEREETACRHGPNLDMKAFGTRDRSAAI